jgi:isopenicillin N synthase-like dioxygenase
MPTIDSVPLIDITRLEYDADAERSLERACQEWGFFQVIGHGVPDALLHDVHLLMRELFALPYEQKQAIERSAVNHWGYYDRELTKNQRDWKQVFDVGPSITEGPLAGSEPQWPDALPSLQPAIEQYQQYCERLANRLLAAIARTLNTPESTLIDAFKPRHSSFVRLNYYPICDDPSAQLGIHPHTDAGALTVLLQDEQPGLQVLRDGDWYTVQPRSDAFVINIGDIVQVWSNDRYRAPLHRVLANTDGPRYSAPYFHNPAEQYDYAPLASVCEHEKPRYQPINWGAFRAARAAGDYADHGEEIQIAHFRAGAAVPQVYEPPQNMNSIPKVNCRLS